jgi:hypothetical protein
MGLRLAVGGSETPITNVVVFWTCDLHARLIDVIRKSPQGAAIRHP